MVRLGTLRDVLSNPAMYRCFQQMIGREKRFIPNIVKEYIRPKGNYKILDIGCGPAYILKYLPDADYVGFDNCQEHIFYAKKRFGNGGAFFVGEVSRNAISEVLSFDIVLALGVLHHLDDGESIQLFKLARSTLKPGGRLVTVDGGYVAGQSFFARYLLSWDRGQYVRRAENYEALASTIFTDVRINIRHDLFRIPYTHIILECSS